MTRYSYDPEQVQPEHVEPQPVQAIPIRPYGRQRGRASQSRSAVKRPWRDAYRLYKANPKESQTMLFITKALSLWIPVNVIDDAIPLLGQLDDPLMLPLIPVTAALVGFSAWRVSRYRK